MHHKLDNDKQVFFYEQEFYPLSNFSSFAVFFCGLDFPTSEHAYHWGKFPSHKDVQRKIIRARSAHDCFALAQSEIEKVRPDWKTYRVPYMKKVLEAKVSQHEYVKRKLMQTGDRELIEDSWRDSFWGWGEHRDGENALGKLWMKIRDEIRYPESI